MPLIPKRCNDTNNKISNNPILEEFMSMSLEKGRTDLANSRRLVRMHSNDIKYLPESKSWLVWNNHYWAKDIDDCHIQEKAKQVADSLWKEMAEADQSERDKMIRHCRWTSSGKGIREMIREAKSHPNVKVLLKDLDNDPWLLNHPNGTLNLRTGYLKEADRTDLITRVCPTLYKPDAKSPRWELFLSEIFNGDNEVIRFIQRLLGYGITGTVNEQVLPIFWGDGSNGKSTLVETVSSVLGDDYVGVAPTEMLMLQKHEMHPAVKMILRAKRIVTTQEAKVEARLNENLIKQLTSTDAVAARGMHQDWISFNPSHKILLSTNNKPLVRGDDFAIWRRLVLIPFTVRFDERTKDKNLLDKLISESEGILAWIVRGCLEWQKIGLQLPQSVLIATNEYKEEQSEITNFIKECCELGPDFVVGASQLYYEFKQFNCDSELSQNSFGRLLTKNGIGRSNGTGNYSMRTGIKLKDNLTVKEE